MMVTATTMQKLLFIFLISLNAATAIATAQGEKILLRNLCKLEFFRRLRICQCIETASPSFASKTLAPSASPSFASKTLAPSHTAPVRAPVKAPGGVKCFEDGDELRDAVNTYIVGDPEGTLKSTYGDPIGSWCVGKVTDMSSLFGGATSFNEDISDWNVSSVKNMAIMFADAKLFKGDISNWNVLSVTDMDGMFSGAASFNGDISNWNVSSVTSMSYMFSGATSFNRDISNWNVSSVTDMEAMFSSASAFNQNLCAWGTISDPGVYNPIMFLGTNCPTTADPDYTQSPPGPFCYNC